MEKAIKKTNVAVNSEPSRYFELFWPSTKLPLNWRKPENDILQRYKKNQRDNDKPQKNKDG